MNHNHGNNIEDFSIGPSSSSILPTDSVSHSSWLDQNIFGISSFDGYFRIYKVIMTLNNPYFDLLYEFKYKFPITHFTFISKSSLVAIGSIDGKVILIDFNSQSNRTSQNFKIIDQLSSHILKLFFVEEINIIIAVNSENICHAIDIQSMKKINQFKSYCDIMDCDLVFPYLVLALSTNQLEFVNVENLKR